jgi:TP901 family phage tail tape measure protein
MVAGREDLGSAVLELVTDPTKLRAGMAAARQETAKTLNDANAALRGIGQNMTATGGQMTRGITVPVLAAGAAIVSVGGDFQHTMSQIVGLVGISREQITAWTPEIEALAKATGIGPNELAKGLYFVASSGIAASKAMGVLTIAAKASEAGMGDVNVLADVLTGTMNAYAKSNLTAAHAMDVLVRGIQVGKAEPADFAAALGTVAPAAAQLGVTIEDLVGTMAILSRTNSNVAENSTSLGQIFNTLLKPTAQTTAALDKMGLSAEGLRQELSEKGLVAVLKTLGDHIGDDDEAIAQIFPNIRALRGVLNLTGQDALSVSEAMAKVADSTGALDDAVTAIADDATVKMNKALATMQVQLILLSSDVLPLVVDLFNKVAIGIQAGVEWFTALPGPVKETVVQGLALLAVLGPILIILGSIITAGTAIVGAFGAVAGFMTATLIPRFATFLAMLAGGAIETFATVIFATGIPALEGLGVALLGVESMAGPLLAVAAAIIAIGAAASGAKPSAAELRKQIADLESEGGLFGFLDFGREGKIALFKKALADVEQAEADAAAKERADLADRQQAWTDWKTAITGTLGDLTRDLGAGGLPNAVGGMIDDIDAGLKSGKYQIKNGALVMASGIPAGVKSQGAAAVRAVTISIGDMARAIRDGRRAIVDAMNEVVDQAYDPLILAADIAATKVELAEQRKIAASKNSTRAEKREANLQILQLQKQLATQLNDQTQYGTDAQRLALLTGRATSKELLKGLKSGDKARRQFSQEAAADIARDIIALESKMGIYGTRTGNAYIDGLVAAFEERMASVRRQFQKLKNIFQASSPPGPESPLHEIDKWGYRTGEAFITPMASAIAFGAPAIRRSLGAIASAFGAAGGAGDRRLSVTSRALAGAVPLAGSVGEAAGQVTNNYVQNVKLEGAPKARDPLEVARQLGRFARTRKLERDYGNA